MIHPTYAMVYYAAIKNNEEDFCIQVWSDLQNILSDKSKMQGCVEYATFVFFKKGNICIFANMFIDLDYLWKNIQKQH